MLRASLSAMHVGTMLVLCLMMTVLLSACQTISVTCPGGGASGGVIGEGGCPPTTPKAGKLYQGALCTSGSVCMFEGAKNCNIATPLATCQTVNNAGQCSCNCM
jgi:hypothetical protein